MKTIVNTFALAFFLNAGVVKASDNFTLVCEGIKTLFTEKNIGDHRTTETYEFKNGRFQSWRPGETTINAIEILFFGERDNKSCTHQCNRMININRISGKVIDTYHDTHGGRLMGHSFEGICRLGAKKF